MKDFYEMNEHGMLWYDDDPKRTLADKVLRAVEYYRTKYGKQATTCRVCPSQYVAGAGLTAGVKVVADKLVHKNCFLVGTE